MQSSGPNFPPLSPLTALVTVVVTTLYVIRWFIWNCMERNGLPLPPGPSRLPLLGSVLSFNSSKPWITFAEWRAKYGDVIYARILGSDVVVLNSFAVAKELLAARSTIYSNRAFVATAEPYGLENSLIFSQYGPEWRLERRMMHQTFRTESALALRQTQLRRAREMVINMIDDSIEYSSHYITFSAAVSLFAIYDYDAQPKGDPMVNIMIDFVEKVWPEILSEKILLFKIFPFLSSVPKWVPVLSRMSRRVEELKALSQKLIDTPYLWARKCTGSQEALVSDKMVFDHVRRMDKMDNAQRNAYENLLKLSATSALFADAIMAGASGSTLMCFTDAMVKHPHVWKRAQQEIDSVIGSGRLPEFDDRSALPYVDAIMRETYRWNPIAPLGFPHATSGSDVYDGYYIPEGAVVVPNVWAMTRDETRYLDPEAFLPERFLDADGMLTSDDPADYVFGFGRRSCPGRHVADASLWSVMATMLATLNFDAVDDANAKFKNKSAISNPECVPCQLTLRPHVSKEFLQRSLLI